MTDFNIETFGNKTVGVVFRNTKYAEGYEKMYTYRIPMDMTIIKGDLAVVEKDDVYSIVTIVRIDIDSKLSDVAPFRYKWICCIVQREEYLERQMEEEDLIMKNASKLL